MKALQKIKFPVPVSEMSKSEREYRRTDILLNEVIDRLNVQTKARKKKRLNVQTKARKKKRS